MDSINFNVNLLKLSRVGVVSIKGVKCVVIPIEENDIYVSQDRETGKTKSAYLNLTAWANKNGLSQYGDSHYIRQSFSKEAREANAVFVKKAPVLGNGKPVQSQGNAASSVVVQSVDNQLDNNDDIPF